jgi:hypothetical protein
VWKREETYIQVSVGKPERKTPHGRPRRRLEDNIKMDPQCVEWRGVAGWINVAGCFEHGNEQCGEFLD